MMRARHLLAVAVCLLAGVLIQALVAWVLFVHTAYTGGTGVLRDPVLKAGERTATGFVVPADWNSRTLVGWWGVGKTRETVSECIWAGSTLGMTSGGGRQATYEGFSAGWPMRSFCGCDYITPGLERFAPASLVDVPAWIKGGGHQVPVSPLWGGFVVNTFLFSVPAIGVVRVVGWRREARRRYLGLCAGCGYPVKGLARCPECGAARDAKGGT